MRYAQETAVPVDRSKAEIERTLTRYGAEQFMTGWKGGEAVIAFRMNNRIIQFVLPLPSRNDPTFMKTPTGRARRNPDDALKAWEQSCRQRWRALSLAIKAKLEAVECGITDFETEFMAHIVLPDGKTVAAHLLPKLDQIYSSRKVQGLLPEW